MSCTRNERDLAAENSNFPCELPAQADPPAPPLPPPLSLSLLFPPLALRSHYEHFSFVHFMDISLFIVSRYLKVQASRSPDTVILYTQRHDASGRKENDNLEPRAVIVRELNFDSQQLFAISLCYVENCITDPRRGKSSITWRYGDDRSTHLVMLHDGSGLSLGGHIQSPT